MIRSSAARPNTRNACSTPSWRATWSCSVDPELSIMRGFPLNPLPALPCASIRCADCLLDPLQGGSGEELPNRNTHFALVLFYPELLQNAHTEQGLAEVRGNRRGRILDQEWPELELRNDRSTRAGRTICRLHQDLISAIYLR